MISRTEGAIASYHMVVTTWTIQATIIVVHPQKTARSMRELNIISSITEVISL